MKYNVFSLSSYHIPRQSHERTLRTHCSFPELSQIASSRPISNHPGKPYQLYVWGTSRKGTIPIVQESKLYEPTEVNVQMVFDIDNKSTTLQNIICGPNSTAVLLSNNTCYTFGDNSSGQLGHGNRNDTYTCPTLLSPFSSTSPLQHNEISQISLGSNFSAIIDIHGNVYTCGYNGSILKEGQGCLGHGYLTETEYLPSPTLVSSLIEDGIYAKQVAVGASHMALLTTEGEVLTTGAGAYGRCGNIEPVDQLSLEPVELLASETDVCQIVAGNDFTLVLTEKNGIVYAFGRNDKGQCGTGSGLGVELYAMEPMPIPVEGLLEGRKVIKIAAGLSHAAVVTDQGELFVWGMGQSHLPEYMSTLGHTKIVDVDCGHDYTVVVDENGMLYTFGKNGKRGVLGLGEERIKAVQPMLVNGTMEGLVVQRVSAGWNHVACLV